MTYFMNPSRQRKNYFELCYTISTLLPTLNSLKNIFRTLWQLLEICETDLQRTSK